MRSLMLIASLACCLSIVGLGFADDQEPVKPVQKRSSRAPEKSNTEKPEGVGTKAAASGAHAADEQEIRALAQSYMKAYAEGDGKKVAAHFTMDAEYVDEEGTVTLGRAALEEQLTANFAENPGETLKVKTESARFISPVTAIVDGMTILTTTKGTTLQSPFTAIFAKADEKWLIASVRDFKSKPHGSRSEQLKQFDWLLGDWIHEGDGSIINFSCRPIDNGNFLLREFTFKIQGRAVMSGSQRIGWDPVAGRFQAWTFDSQGGFGHGVWNRDGESWVLKTSGQSGDGETASVTSVFTPVSPHMITWQNLEYVVNGEQLPPTPVMKLVRKPPQSKTTGK
ncbi:MAG: SgcJ/EcaC family oxidoreductase [Planctomycetales bacterium]